MNDDQTEFLWNVHSYTSEFIRFADAKAAAVLGWSGALLGALYANHSHTRFLDGRLSGPDWLNAWSALCAYVLLAASFIFALSVVTPRLTWQHRNPNRDDLIFWGAIHRFKTDSDYWDAICQHTNLARSAASHVFTLSDIAVRKYRCVTLGIYFALSGSLAAIIVLFS